MGIVLLVIKFWKSLSVISNLAITTLITHNSQPGVKFLFVENLQKKETWKKCRYSITDVSFQFKVKGKNVGFPFSIFM